MLLIVYEHLKSIGLHFSVFDNDVLRLIRYVWNCVRDDFVLKDIYPSPSIDSNLLDITKLLKLLQLNQYLCKNIDDFQTRRNAHDSTTATNVKTTCCCVTLTSLLQQIYAIKQAYIQNNCNPLDTKRCSILICKENAGSFVLNNFSYCTKRNVKIFQFFFCRLSFWFVLL